jgi:hypothetical protein
VIERSQIQKVGDEGYLWPEQGEKAKRKWFRK